MIVCLLAFKWSSLASFPDPTQLSVACSAYWKWQKAGQGLGTRQPCLLVSNDALWVPYTMHAWTIWTNYTSINEHRRMERRRYVAWIKIYSKITKKWMMHWKMTKWSDSVLGGTSVVQYLGPYTTPWSNPVQKKALKSFKAFFPCPFHPYPFPSLPLPSSPLPSSAPSLSCLSVLQTV